MTNDALRRELIAIRDELRRVHPTESKDEAALEDVVVEEMAPAGLTDDGEPTAKKHSILELQGLGKEIWESIDVDEYVRQERDSWR